MTCGKCAYYEVYEGKEGTDATLEISFGGLQAGGYIRRA